MVALGYYCRYRGKQTRCYMYTIKKYSHINLVQRMPLEYMYTDIPLRRSNIIFGCGQAGVMAHKRTHMTEEEDDMGSHLYQELKRSIKEHIHFNLDEGFVNKSLLLFGPPKCGKSDLLLQIFSKIPTITVFCLKVGDFVNTDISLFFEMAKTKEFSIILIEDLDSILCPSGKAYNLKRELFLQMYKLYHQPKNARRNLLVIGESRYPWHCDPILVNRFFPQKICMQLMPQFMVVQVQFNLKFPREWIDEQYLRDFQIYKEEYVDKMVTEPVKSKFHRFVQRFNCFRSS